MERDELIRKEAHSEHLKEEKEYEASLLKSKNKTRGISMSKKMTEEQKREAEKPLESQKMDIVNTILGMNSEMRDFSGKIGERLDELYKQGGAGQTAGKKYGYGGAN
jgi:hypothetical protein